MNNPKKFNWKRKKTTSTLESKKVRTYAPLLNEEQKQSASIQDLSYDVASYVCFSILQKTQYIKNTSLANKFSVVVQA